MKKIIALLLILAVGISICACNTPTGQDGTTTTTSSSLEENNGGNQGNENPNNPPQSTKAMKAVLLLGQSNMAGRGDINSVEKIDDDRIFMMRNLEWVKMVEPIFTDKDTAGTGPASAFAQAFVETYDVKLGLIPAAVGGTSLEDWKVGGSLYNKAIEMADKALEDADIVAVLWHQGESDTMTSGYAKKLTDIMTALYDELGLDKNTVPFITGELFEKGPASENKDFVADPGAVNNALTKVKNFKKYAVVSGKGLRHKGDRAHLDAPSTRVLGYRYFVAYYELVEGKDCPFQFNEDLDSYLIK